MIIFVLHVYSGKIHISETEGNPCNETATGIIFKNSNDHKLYTFSQLQESRYTFCRLSVTAFGLVMETMLGNTLVAFPQKSGQMLCCHSFTKG